MDSTHVAALSTIAQVIAGFAAIAFAVVLVRLSAIEQSLSRVMQRIAEMDELPFLQDSWARADYDEFSKCLKTSGKTKVNGIESLISWFEHDKKRRESLIFELNLSLGMTVVVVVVCLFGLVYNVGSAGYLGFAGGL